MSGLAGPLTAEPGADAPLAAAHRFLLRLTRPSTLLVALSGGSDSTGLLLALHAANTPSCRHRLVACTVDHALRPDAALEAEAVARRCAAFGIPHHIARWSHDGIGSALQARARLARYGLLAEAAASFSADVIVTGHTADDQAETVAMRHARSGDTGAQGLSGMADAVLFDGRIWICRPFLDIRRESVRDFLRHRGEGWIDDPSNRDPRFERVRIREQLDGGTGATAPWTGRTASGEAVARLLAEHVRLHCGLVAEIAGSPDLPADADGQRLLKVLTAVIGGKAQGLGRDMAHRLFSALSQNRPGAWTAGRVVFERRGGRLYLYRERRNLPECSVEAGARVLWDGRFAIENGSDAALVVEGGGRPGLGDDLVASGVPAGVAKRAVQAAPSLTIEAAGAVVKVIPVIAPYDTFLPRFDLMIANTIAALFGRAPFPSCPVDDVSTK